MTTIAVNGNAMASDGQETSGETITGFSAVKIQRLEDGSLVGVAGISSEMNAFIVWLQGGTKPKLKEMAALVLRPNGKLFYYSENLLPLEVETPYAIGTGGDFALIAMDLGKSPEEAVIAAMNRDIYSGGTVNSLKLEPVD